MPSDPRVYVILFLFALVYILGWVAGGMCERMRWINAYLCNRPIYIGPATLRVVSGREVPRA